MSSPETHDLDTTAQFRDYMEELRSICSDRARMNFRASEKYSRLAAWLTIANLFASIFILFFVSNEGALAVVNALVKPISTIIGYQSPTGSGGTFGNLVIGILGTLAVATAALQYVLKYEERLMIHKYYGADYENMARKIHRLLVGGEIDKETVHRTNRQMNYLSRHAPIISTHILRPAWHRRLGLFLFGPFQAKRQQNDRDKLRPGKAEETG